MWRLNGIRVFHPILLLITSVELVALLAVSTASLLRPFDTDPLLLKWVIGTTLVSNLIIVVFTLLFHAISHYLDLRQRRLYQGWLDRWTALIMDESPPLLPTHSRLAMRALLDIQQTLSGVESQRLSTIIRGQALQEYWLKQLAARSQSIRLEALEALAVVGLVETLPFILRRFDDPAADIRMASARAAASIIGRLSLAGDLTPDQTRLFSAALVDARLEIEQFEEVILMTEQGAHEVVTWLLSQKHLPPALLQGCIHLVGKLKMEDIAYLITPFVRHSALLLRASALRTFAQLDQIPVDAHSLILHAVTDPNPQVRVQAVAALRHVPFASARLPLWLALADEDWWVRLAAAETAQRIGVNGWRMLKAAASTHKDAQAAWLAAEHLRSGAGRGDDKASEWIWSRI